MVPENPERELSSWKEIAAHPGVSVRTAQDRERSRGLPVRRLPGVRRRPWWADAPLICYGRDGRERWRFLHLNPDLTL